MEAKKDCLLWVFLGCIYCFFTWFISNIVYEHTSDFLYYFTEIFYSLPFLRSLFLSSFTNLALSSLLYSTVAVWGVYFFRNMLEDYEIYFFQILLFTFGFFLTFISYETNNRFMGFPGYYKELEIIPAIWIVFINSLEVSIYVLMMTIAIFNGFIRDDKKAGLKTAILQQFLIFFFKESIYRQIIEYSEHFQTISSFVFLISAIFYLMSSKNNYEFISYPNE